MDDIKGFFRNMKEKIESVFEDDNKENESSLPERFSVQVTTTDTLHTTFQKGDDDRVYVCSVEEGSELWDGGVRSVCWFPSFFHVFVDMFFLFSFLVLYAI